MRYAWLSGLVLCLLPAVASADRRGGHFDDHRDHRNSFHARSGFSLSFGLGFSDFPRAYRSYDYYRPSYAPVYYYPAPVYCPPPRYDDSCYGSSYYDAPVYYSAPPVYYRPAPRYTYYDSSYYRSYPSSSFSFSYSRFSYHR